MSGGFFRGTSADQDTRFSNKQAKLLKTQKFAPELDHPVDMTKVKMDVIRPWIATRATELLGFEDEVLINFVYGLLDGKEVDGKQIQIQLTGFLEKNTGKFMKELWALLLSAQNNASGIPQQFLDAKEEEINKRKVENDRITQEIQKRKEKEGREFEQDKQKRMDVEAGNSRSTNAVSGSSLRHSLPRDSRVQSEKERDMETGRSPRLKGRSTSSPSQSFSKSASKSGSSNREGRSRSVSISSQSRGRSISPGRQDHSPPRHSMSSEGRYMSPARRPISPRHRYSPQSNWSPPRGRSPYARRRSPSLSRHRSPSPIRRRSPSFRRRSPPPHHRSPAQNHRRSPSPSRHRRSPSPARRRRSPSPARRRRSPSPPRRRRSPSPARRKRSPSLARHRRSRSPARRRRSRSPGRRRRSPSPARHKMSPSPVRRRRSPSPARRRMSPSPVHHKISHSPAHHTSPIRRRSLSPAKHRSPSPPMRRSPADRSHQLQRRSPLHSPRNYGGDSQMSPQARKRYRSPCRSSSPSYQTHRDSSREIHNRSNGFDSRKRQDELASRRVREKRSPVHDPLHREVTEWSNSRRSALDLVPRRLPGSSRSSSRDFRDQNDIHNKDPGVPSENSSERSGSARHLRRTSPRRNRPSENTVKQAEKRMLHEIPVMEAEKEQASVVREDVYRRTDSPPKKGKDSAADMKKKRSCAKESNQEEYNNNGLAVGHSPGTQGHPSKMSSKKKESEHKSDKDILKRPVREMSGSPDDMEYSPGRVQGEKHSKDVSYDGQHLILSVSDAERQPKSRSDAYRDSHNEADSHKSSKRKMDTSSRVHGARSDSQETNAHNKYRSSEKRRHKKSDKHKIDSDDLSESDSHTEDRKEAKRRRKDERRLRKEEKRRKREEKHRRRLERHAGKLKLKSVDTVTPPSDFEKDQNDAGKSDDEAPTNKASHLADTEETDSAEKKLEIELREKALESLRARKAIRQ